MRPAFADGASFLADVAILSIFLTCVDINVAGRTKNLMNPGWLMWCKRPPQRVVQYFFLGARLIRWLCTENSTLVNTVFVPPWSSAAIVPAAPVSPTSPTLKPLNDVFAEGNSNKRFGSSADSGVHHYRALPST